MKTTTLLAAAALVASASFAHAAVEPQRIVIGDNPGGSVLEYQSNIMNLMLVDAKIAIAGKCYSACTMLLFEQYAFDLCVSEFTVFGFHKAYSFNKDGTIVQTARAQDYADNLWDWWLRNSPHSLRAYLEAQDVPSPAHGDSPADMLLIKGSDLLPLCTSDEPITEASGGGQ